MSRLEEQLLVDEGLRLKPYKDTVGKLTIGIGRNLDDVGITKDEAIILLRNDIARTTKDVIANIPWWSGLDEVRRDVIINMAFNLGIEGLLKFKRTLLSIQNGEYEQASKEMLESKWAKQVGNRAKRLAEMMRTGEY